MVRQHYDGRIEIGEGMMTIDIRMASSDSTDRFLRIDDADTSEPVEECKKLVVSKP